MKFYTSVMPLRNHILYRWVEDGLRLQKRVEYRPTYYLPSKEPTEHKTLQGEYVSPVNPGTLWDCRQFTDQYKDVDNFHIYGNIGHQYQFIGDEYKENIDFDVSKIRVANLDIEVASEDGFALPTNPTEEVTAITVRIGGRFHTFGCFDFHNQDPEVSYYKCMGETDLLTKFLNFWGADYPDVVTGWHIEFYDIPYLVNRITKVLGEEYAQLLSPWKFLKARDVNTGMGGRTQQAYNIYGVAVLDYLALFKKFAPGGASQESYKLDDIGFAIVNERKVKYEGTLHELYKNDYQKFIEYNIHDTRIVKKLDDKLKLLELAYILAFNSRVNFEDVFFQTRMWDSLIYNYLRARNIVIPPRRHVGSSAIIGAYVKDPMVGMFRWLVSFDFSSLYPSLMIALGISPDNFIGMSPMKYELEKLVNKEYDLSEYKDKDLVIAANGAMFKKKRGFLVELLEDAVSKRKFYKKRKLEYQNLYENAPLLADKEAYEKEMSKCDGFQSSMKIRNNSSYGALSNAGFRYYNPNLGEAVTLSAQLAIKWVISRTNAFLNKLLKTVDVDCVVAADTDSMYLNMAGIVDQMFTEAEQKADPQKVTRFLNSVCEKSLQPFIQKCCDELIDYMNGTSGVLDMKRESIANKGFWTTKKRYALNVFDKEGVTYPEPKIAITGLEIVRSSTPMKVRSKLKESLKIIMNGDNEEMLTFIDTFKSDFMQMPVEDISFPRGIYDLQKYTDTFTIYKKGTPIHVKGSLIYNNLIRKKGLKTSYPMIGTSEKIKFVYLKEPNTIGHPVIAFPGTLPKEFELDEYIDRRTQFEKTFLDPISTILNAIGWQAERVSTLF